MRRLSIRTVTFSVLVASALLGSAQTLRALDFFGSEAKEPASVDAPSATGQLPSVAEVAKAAMPAVVNISSTPKREPQGRSRGFGGEPPSGGGDPMEEFFRRYFGERERPPAGQQRSLGSGFIISPDGYIVTNNHVVGEADKITVKLSGAHEQEYEAKVIGADEKTDLALIKIEAKQPLPTVPLGNSENLRVGDWVVAIGNPFGLEQTVTVGIVSAKGRVIGAGPYDDFIQTDASINPGNSGGPLLNLKGEVIGVNTAIFSRSGGNVGIGFAIPAALAKPIVAQLRDSGKVARGWLGVSIQTVTQELAKSFGLAEAKGALVAELTPGGPAEKSGLERGDVIIKFNDMPVADSHELPAVVARTPIGTKVPVTVLRGGKEKIVTVTLGELSDTTVAAASGEATEKNWGVAVADLSAETARRFSLDRAQGGVVVTDIDQGSPAETAGVRPGDVIEEVNRQRVQSVKDFNEAITAAAGKDALLLLVRRGEAASFLALRKSG